MNVLTTFLDHNPQLLRECRGRINLRNCLLTLGASILGQLLWLALRYQQLMLPGSPGFYCLKSNAKAGPPCLADVSGVYESLINWPLWWQDVFLGLSFWESAILIVGGSFLLIDNLGREERLGTLNLLRLSPQSPNKLLQGKLLGVPILLYLAAFAALPLHWWAGLAAQMPVLEILCFDGLTIAACFFFYSLALWFGIAFTWIPGVQAWVGTGLIFLFFMTATHADVRGNLQDWLNIFVPSTVFPYLLNHAGRDSLYLVTQLRSLFDHDSMAELSWFRLPIGQTGLGVALFCGGNCLVWGLWLWRSLLRRFQNPRALLWTKLQSYGLMTCFVGCSLGFLLTDLTLTAPKEASTNATNLLQGWLDWQILALVVWTLVLQPPRQALLDWARYRHQLQQIPRSQRSPWNLRTLLRAWNHDNSPALGAIAIHSAITSLTIMIAVVILILVLPTRVLSYETHPIHLYAVAMKWGACLLLVMVCTLMLHLIRLAPLQRQGAWMAASLGVVLLGPPLGLSLFRMNDFSPLWLYTMRALSVEDEALGVAWLVGLGYIAILGLLGLVFNRKMQVAGRSTTQALLTAKPRGTVSLRGAEVQHN